MSGGASTRVQFLTFARAHARELLRNTRAWVTLWVSFAVLLGLFWSIDLLMATTTGSPSDFLRRGLPLVAVTGFSAIALILTTVPLVMHRGSGLLRQLSTTPARRRAFLLGHVPVRAAILTLMVLALTAMSVAAGVAIRDVGLLALTLLLGGTMMLAFGYLLAARMTNPDHALQCAYIVPIIMLVTSGAMLPLDMLPGWITTVFRALPSTWFVDTLNAQLAGSAPFFPVGVNWALMMLCAVVTACVAERFHQWAP